MMKRFHVSVAVADLGRSTKFYSTLFGAEPTVLKNDYAKWMLEDPRINFSISTSSSRQHGISHIGLQLETLDELAEIQSRFEQAKAQTVDEANARCCYATSTKTWVRDPDDVAWETFVTHGEITTYGDDRLRDVRKPANSATTCCGSESRTACCV